MTTSQHNTTDIEDGEDDEGPHRPGEFDQDEPEEVLRKVMASKSSVHPSQARASAGSGSGSLSRSSTPAISQWGGARGGPLVTRKTDQVRIELLTAQASPRQSLTDKFKDGGPDYFGQLDHQRQRCHGQPQE